MSARRGYAADAYRLRRGDVRKAMRALNRPSNAGALYEALRDLLGHAEKIEREGE